MTLVIYSDMSRTGQEQFMLVDGTVEQVRDLFERALRYGLQRGAYYENVWTGLDAEQLNIENFTFKSLIGAPAIQKVFKDFLGESFGNGLLPQILEQFPADQAEETF